MFQISREISLCYCRQTRSRRREGRLGEYGACEKELRNRVERKAREQPLYELSQPVAIGFEAMGESKPYGLRLSDACGGMEIGDVRTREAV